MKKVLIFLLLIFCTIQCYASDNDFKTESKVDFKSGQLDIECTLVSPKEESVTITILKPGKKLTDINESEVKNVVFHMDEKESENGKCEFSYIFPKNSDAGIYTIVTTVEGVSKLYSEPLYYVSEKVIKSTYDALLAESLKENKKELISSFLKNNYQELNIIDIYNHSKEYIGSDSAVVDFACGYDFSIGNAEDFKSKLEENIGIIILKKATVSNVKKIISDVSPYLGNEVSIANYTDNEQKLLVDGISANNYTKKSEWVNFIKKTNIVVQLNSMEWNTIYECLKTNKDILEFDFGVTINSIKYKEEVYKKMSSAVMTDALAVQKAYNNAVSEQYSYENSSNGSGSIGGSGSTGGKTNVSVSGNTTPDTITPKEEYFDDLQQAKWAVPYINLLTKNGIISENPEKKFRPNDNITREEFVKILVLSLKVDLQKGDLPFNDTENDAWYAPYIYSANKMGIVQGDADGNFGICKEITRQDMMVMVYRGIKSKIKTDEKAEEFDFLDKNLIAEYATQAVNTLCKMDIVSGYEDGNFKPLNNAKRAEAAKIICESFTAN